MTPYWKEPSLRFIYSFFWLSLALALAVGVWVARAIF